MLEDRSPDELELLATSKGISLTELAPEVGVAVDEITTTRIIDAIRSLVLNAVARGCPGCWIR